MLPSWSVSDEVTYDHPDPSIGCVQSSDSEAAGPSVDHVAEQKRPPGRPRATVAG